VAFDSTTPDRTEIDETEEIRMMTMLRPMRLGAALAILTVPGCAKQDNAFWQAGARYDVTLVVAERSASLQAKRDSLRLRDTIPITLEVDSLARDSVFGSYHADWTALGTWVGAASPSPQRFAGRSLGPRLTVVLSPNAIDAAATMTGKIDGGQATGTWVVESAAVRGTFNIGRR
jgi:hypothetical protein